MRGQFIRATNDTVILLAWYCVIGRVWFYELKNPREGYVWKLERPLIPLTLSPYAGAEAWTSVSVVPVKGRVEWGRHVFSRELELRENPLHCHPMWMLRRDRPCIPWEFESQTLTCCSLSIKSLSRNFLWEADSPCTVVLQGCCGVIVRVFP